MQKNKIRVLMLIISLSCLSTTYGATFDVSTPARIQKAFDDAAHNGQDDTISIAAGHYPLDQTLTYIQGEQYSITIQGAGMGQTILDGGGKIQVMAIDTTRTSKDYGTTVTVKGLTIQNGYTAIDGGGLSIKTRQAHPIIESSSFLSNQAFPPEPTNWLDWGDGGGGGLFVATGVNNRDGDVTVQNCLFKDNKSTYGGGAYLWAADELLPVTKVINNIFDNNKSANSGGGLWICATLPTVLNNTLINNKSESYGGGFYFYGGSTIYFWNNIAWGNSSTEKGSDVYFYDLWSKRIKISSNTYGNIAFLEGDTYSEEETSNENPLIDASYQLSENSKCINSGDNDAPDLPTTDYKGNRRISGSTVDRGAIEYGSSPGSAPDPNPDPGEDNNSGAGGGSGCFVETIFACMGIGFDIDTNSDAYKAAKRLSQKHRSIEVQSSIERQKDRLKPMISKQRNQTYQKSCSANKSEFKTGKNELLIFISGSMPQASTRKFVIEANQLTCDVKFILNGQPRQGIGQFVNTIKDPQQKMYLHIDPLLFDAYDIQSVPVLVLNRSILVKHPESIRKALLVVQKTTGQDLTDWVRPITH